VKRNVAIAVVLVLSIALMGMTQEKTDAERLEWAMALMQDAIVIDGHSDTPSRVVRGFDMSKRNDEGHMDIPRLLEAGVNGQFLAAFIYPSKDVNPVERAMQMIDATWEVARKDDRFVIALTAQEILDAKAAGKVAGIPAIENGKAINNNIRNLRMFYKMGVRYMTLTWMDSNEWADASGPDQSRYYGDYEVHGGLTEFGVEIVKEMNRLGMIVDISHTHDDTFWDVMETTTKPVIASHSCVYAINPHYRNIKDDMLKAMAKNGGVIGLNFAPGFLSAEYNENSNELRAIRQKEAELLEVKYKDDAATLETKMKELRAAYGKDMEQFRLPISVIGDHLEHIRKVAGIDVIGLGSDFDGIGDVPIGLEDCTGLVNIVIEMDKRGWSESDIRKMLGENFLRVIREVTGG
jgi:membrane dipeptidase